MGRKTAAKIVSMTDPRALRGAILTKATATTLYRSKVEKLAQDSAERINEIAEQHYSAAINAIDDLMEHGYSGARAPKKRIGVETGIAGVQSVSVSWPALNNNWLNEKMRRSAPGYKRRKKTGRGRSYGPSEFWLDQRKFSSAFKRSIVGKGAAVTTPTLREIKNGEVLMTFETRLNELPASYLDRAIRRALIEGTVGVGGKKVAFDDLPSSELTSSARPRGLYRGSWPEAMRPTMRPISLRLGRAMKEQIRRSLARR